MIRLVRAGLAEKIDIEQKGRINGVAPLNEIGKVDPQYLSGYVNSVVGIYITDPEISKAYIDRAHTKRFTDFDVETIYNDLHGSGSYRWNGEQLCLIPDTSAMVEITAEEVQKMWDSIDETGLNADELLARLDASLAVP